jgi:hypothetical protein
VGIVARKAIRRVHINAIHSACRRDIAQTLQARERSSYRLASRAEELTMAVDLPATATRFPPILSEIVQEISTGSLEGEIREWNLGGE